MDTLTQTTLFLLLNDLFAVQLNIENGFRCSTDLCAVQCIALPTNQAASHCINRTAYTIIERAYKRLFETKMNTFFCYTTIKRFRNVSEKTINPVHDNWAN